MKGKIKTVIGCTASVAALTMFTSMAVLAEGNSDSIENTVWSYRAVANVMTQVNIRAYASTDSAIIGYLPKAGAADVIERGEEWSHIISNGVEGYIKNEYLAFGSEAKKLAEVYGMPGVETNWDEVRVFAAPNAAAKIVATANEGQNYQIISEEGDWISVQLNDSTMAYVPAEDVEKTILLEKAIPVVTSGQTDAAGVSAVQGTGTQESASNAEQVSVQNAGSETEAQTENTTQQETSGETEAWTEAGSDSDYTETPQTESETQQTEVPETETPAAETPVTEAPAEEPSEETVTSASSDDVSLLAALIYCEAGNQSRDGKIAVGAVVLHRVASASFAGSISDVIYQSGQFTPAYSGALASALANGVPSDCYEAAQAALNGEDPVPGALYFNTGSGKGVKIGAHQFY